MGLLEGSVKVRGRKPFSFLPLSLADGLEYGPGEWGSSSHLGM